MGSNRAGEDAKQILEFWVEQKQPALSSRPPSRIEALPGPRLDPALVASADVGLGD